MKREFLKKLGICILALAILQAGLVIFFDPFFHYHKPIGPLKAVLTQEEYQVIGTLRNFDYNALIAGSSMAENYHNDSFSNAFDCIAIKAVKPGANTADLVYLLEKAFEYREVKKIFYTLDISALTSPRRENFVGEQIPTYLYNENPFDDVQYLFNKDILFKEIPYMAATSLLTGYDEGNSFNWAQYKDFSIMYYEPTKESQPMQTRDEYGENVDYNVDLLADLVKTHPETEFIFIVPPYSSLWWYEARVKGELEADFYALKQAFEGLLTLDNVSIHYFQHIEEITANLDMFMDLVHFHPDVNEYIVKALQTGEHKVTAENKDELLREMSLLAEKCADIYADEYFKTLEE